MDQTPSTQASGIPEVDIAALKKAARLGQGGTAPDSGCSIGNGYHNGMTNGHTNGCTDCQNGLENGYANGCTNGHENGYENGHTNGYSNGFSHGSENGYVAEEGCTNGHAENGYSEAINGYAEDEAKAVPEAATPSDLHVHPLNLKDKNRQRLIVEKLEGLWVTEEELKRIYDAFGSELYVGLAKNPPEKSSLQMENTFVPELPNGTEHGDFLALDLGGTNFRVILLRLNKGAIEAEIVKYFNVPDNIRLGPGVDLFDFLAECIKEFMIDQDLIHKKALPLGFCFSFPMSHTSLRSALLNNWTKSFNCPGVVGKDVVKMLNESLRKKDIEVDVDSVLNDTTGTLMCGAQLDKRCAIGLILGTGSNACYFEKVRRIQKWEGNHEEEEVIIDTEWGGFGDKGHLDFIRTDYDRDVDRMSVLPHTFTFEKYFSGKYMGEVVRVILEHLARSGLMFEGKGSESLFTHSMFPTAYVSKIENDTLHGTSQNTEEVLKEINVPFDEEDVEIVKHICSLVSDRAARLVSVCLSYLLNHMRKPDVAIAVDGSLYKLHPRLKDMINVYLKRMVSPHIKFEFILALDGSGKGAGLLAAIARRLELQHQ